MSEMQTRNLQEDSMTAPRKICPPALLHHPASGALAASRLARIREGEFVSASRSAAFTPLHRPAIPRLRQFFNERMLKRHK
jgi:hypothetical protein